jgi:hypothetical protein
MPHLILLNGEEVKNAFLGSQKEGTSSTSHFPRKAIYNNDGIGKIPLANENKTKN